MKRKTLRAVGAAPLPNPANLAQRLRRYRNELSLILQAYDDALERIEKHSGPVTGGQRPEGER